MSWLGERRIRLSLIKLMGLVGLSALALAWPPVVLMALPLGLYRGFRVMGNRWPALAAALTMIAVSLGGAVIVLWVRSHTIADELFWRFSGGFAMARTATGHVVVVVHRIPGLVIPPGVARPDRQTGVADSPFWGDQLWLTPGVILGAEVGDESASRRWGSFGWSLQWNSRLRILRSGVVVPFWSLLLLAVAPLIGWARRRRRAGGLPSAASSQSAAAAVIRPPDG